MFWYIKQSLKSFRNEFICTEGAVNSVLSRKQKKRHIDVQKTFLTNHIWVSHFSNVFLSNKTLFIIRILI